MRSVFNKSEYRRLKHRPVKIIQLLMDDIKCCTERITKGYCSKDVDKKVGFVDKIKWKRCVEIKNFVHKFARNVKVRDNICKYKRRKL